jgi:tight adherence protein C
MLQLGYGNITGAPKLALVPEEYRFKEAAQGLSIAEQQQIARLFLKVLVPPARSLAAFTLLRLILLTGAGGLGFLASSTASWPLPILAAFIASCAGWFLPILIVRARLKSHRKAVAAGLPDTLELLAICVDAGISLESGLRRVSHELEASQPALAGELSQTWAEISILPDRDQAFLNLAERVNLPSLRSVVGTLSQSLRFGTPLAQSLRTAATEMRNDQLYRLEERANRLPALLTVPVMLLIMPTIFLIVGGPAVIKIMDIFAASTVR